MKQILFEGSIFIVNRNINIRIYKEGKRYSFEPVEYLQDEKDMASLLYNNRCYFFVDESGTIACSAKVLYAARHSWWFVRKSCEEHIAGPLGIYVVWHQEWSQPI